MSETYTDFIGMYTDVYEDGYCSHMINEFERLHDSRIVRNRRESENAKQIEKNDFHISVNVKATSFTEFNERCVNQIFAEGLQCCFDMYCDQYDVLRTIDIVGSDFKMQKTPPGGGYHVWHAEQGNNDMASRALVYMLYLNDIKQAGETEFLYQQLRIPPKENCMVIWPASFTHTHRGNTVHGNTSKYVITGWFNV